MAEKLNGGSFLALKNLELLFAYDLELNCLRIRATNQKHILILLPGERVGDRITLFHEAPQKYHRTLPTNLRPRESSVGVERMSDLFKRQTLDQLCDVPDDIIDVYVVERHIWQGGTVDSRGRVQTKAACRASHREGLPDRPGSLAAQRRAAPTCRPLRSVAARSTPSAKDGGFRPSSAPVSRTCCRSSVRSPWATRRCGISSTNWRPRTRRASGSRIYQFYESGLAKKSTGKSKGIFVAVKTLVGQGGGTIGVTDTGRKLTEYILDAVQDQYHAENGKPISVYPVEVLADRFESGPRPVPQVAWRSS